MIDVQKKTKIQSKTDQRSFTSEFSKYITLLFFSAFAADFAEEEKDRERKEAEAKDLENTKQFKEAFERIKRVVASDSSLDKIVADFIKVEDQNFALFNYVTEMNNQVEGLQESIGNVQLFVNLIFILFARWRFKIVCLQTKLDSLAIRKKCNFYRFLTSIFH